MKIHNLRQAPKFVRHLCASRCEPASEHPFRLRLKKERALIMHVLLSLRSLARIEKMSPYRPGNLRRHASLCHLDPWDREIESQNYQDLILATIDSLRQVD